MIYQWMAEWINEWKDVQIIQINTRPSRIQSNSSHGHFLPKGTVGKGRWRGTSHKTNLTLITTSEQSTLATVTSLVASRCPWHDRIKTVVFLHKTHSPNTITKEAAFYILWSIQSGTEVWYIPAIPELERRGPEDQNFKDNTWQLETHLGLHETLPSESQQWN